MEINLCLFNEPYFSRSPFTGARFIMDVRARTLASERRGITGWRGRLEAEKS